MAVKNGSCRRDKCLAAFIVKTLIPLNTDFGMSVFFEFFTSTKRTQASKVYTNLSFQPRPFLSIMDVSACSAPYNFEQ